MATRPRLAITVGDPAGIGPEVAAKALNDAAVRELADFVVFGDRRLWHIPGYHGCDVGPSTLLPLDLARGPEPVEGGAVSASNGSRAPSSAAGPSLAEFAYETVTIDQFRADRHRHEPRPGETGRATPDVTGRVTLVEFPDIDYSQIPAGRVSSAGGEASIRYVLAAIEAVKAGRLDGLVTGPINKEAIREAGYPWPGHTELLAEKFESGDVAMMFAGGPFRVVLVTIHMSLAEVLRQLTTERVLRTVRLADEALKRFFGLAVPRIGVCGLNPHAGEGGRFGTEEHTIITPALDAAREEGLAVFGPLAADTIFRAAMKGKFDAVVAMYHDQGLIPIKTVAFEESVNVTIGLPTIRTSVDHGTAFDIAGKGVADPASMKSAIRLAVAMFRAGCLGRS